MKLNLERNKGANSAEIPFFIDVEIVLASVDVGTIFKVPVSANYSGASKSFAIEICGFRRWADNPQTLLKEAQLLVTSLINIARLPSYVFITKQAGEIYPVYTIGNEVFATTPGGPVFRHVELAKVREYLNDYLHDIGTLGENGLNDKLLVRGVSTRTLGLRRPVFYLKKRVPGQTDFWAPVFETGNGRRIYAYAANARREMPIEAGQEVVLLRELVAQVLLTDGRLADLHDLRPDRLQPVYWERLKNALVPEGQTMVNGVHLDLYSNSYVWVAVEVRNIDEPRYSLFVGLNADNVAERAKVDLDRRGVMI